MMFRFMLLVSFAVAGEAINCDGRSAKQCSRSNKCAWSNSTCIRAVPGCFDSDMLSGQTNCDNCNGMAFIKSLGACSGCIENTNEAINSTNVGSLSPTAVMCDERYVEETCEDNIQNQGEDETDCGGDYCDPCPLLQNGTICVDNDAFAKHYWGAADCAWVAANGYCGLSPLVGITCPESCNAAFVSMDGTCEERMDWDEHVSSVFPGFSSCAELSAASCGQTSYFGLNNLCQVSCSETWEIAMAGGMSPEQQCADEATKKARRKCERNPPGDICGQTCDAVALQISEGVSLLAFHTAALEAAENKLASAIYDGEADTTEPIQTTTAVYSCDFFVSHCSRTWSSLTVDPAPVGFNGTNTIADMCPKTCWQLRLDVLALETIRSTFMSTSGVTADTSVCTSSWFRSCGAFPAPRGFSGKSSLAEICGMECPVSCDGIKHKKRKEKCKDCVALDCTVGDAAAKKLCRKRVKKCANKGYYADQ